MGERKMYNDQTSLNEIIACTDVAGKRELIRTYILNTHASKQRKDKLCLELMRMAPGRLDVFITNLYLVGEGLSVIK